MTCHNCQVRAGKFGKNRNGSQRFRCKQCGATFTEEREKPLDEMRIPLDKATQAIKCLVEGCSIRSTQRLTGLGKKTILRLLLKAGAKCRRLMNREMVKVDARHDQVDELWSFAAKKQKRVRYTDPAEYGDQYVFVAIDPESKLVPCFRVGKRDAETTTEFIRDLCGRLSNRVQLTPDGFRPYSEAVEDAFGADVDYAQLVKIYGAAPKRDANATAHPGSPGQPKARFRETPKRIRFARRTSNGRTSPSAWDADASPD